MVITSFRIIVVEIIGRPIFKRLKEPQPNNWDCQPAYEIGTNANGDTVQNVTFTLIRTKGTNQVTIKTMTSFILTLATKDVVPSTPEDFEFYTLIAQMAAAHTRVIFLNEMKGTAFANDLLPQDSNEGMMRKMRLGLGLKGTEN